METDDDYKKASEMYEEKAKLAVVAEMDIKRDLSAQRSQLKMRLEARKKNQAYARNGSFFEESDTVLKKMPMSTRAGSFIPNRFNNFGKNSSMEEGFAYAPNNRSGAEQISAYLNFNKQKSSEAIIRNQDRQSVSTRANDPMKVIFPNEDSTEARGDMINDISGIVHDISNVEETSFLMQLDSMHTRLGDNVNGNNGSKTTKTQQNLCKKKNMHFGNFNLFSFIHLIIL